MTMRVIEEQAQWTIRDLGLIAYDLAYAFQKSCVQKVLNGGSQTLILCEHPPVITCGRMTDGRHLLVTEQDLSKRSVLVRHIDRGGDVTLHAPGQLVVYPILDLSARERDLHLFLRRLEQVAIDLLDGFGIVADRLKGKTGVWVGPKKIASLGIGVRKWVTFHGLSVNVQTDLSLFSMIKPCGLDVQMTSMTDILKKPVPMGQVKDALTRAFHKSFQ